VTTTASLISNRVWKLADDVKLVQSVGKISYMWLKRFQGHEVKNVGVDYAPNARYAT